MTFLKRHVINAFTFARTGHTETGADCIIWHNVVFTSACDLQKAPKSSYSSNTFAASFILMKSSV